MDQHDPTRLAFDEVVIDLGGHRLLRGGIAQPLEPKAFGVLALLAGTPGRVFTRDQILDAVWGHRHVTPGVLNRVMTLLRHALGEDALGARYLHTVHGVGYRFDLPEVAVEAPAETAQGLEADAPTAAIPARAPMRRANDRPRRVARIALWSLPLLAVLAFAGWQWTLSTAPVPTPAAGVSAMPEISYSATGMTQRATGSPLLRESRVASFWVRRVSRAASLALSSACDWPGTTPHPCSDSAATMSPPAAEKALTCRPSPPRLPRLRGSCDPAPRRRR